jgi:Mg-chelatase subunit ChlD
MRLLFIFFMTSVVSCLYGQHTPSFTCTVEQNLFEVDYPIKITYSLIFEKEPPNEKDKEILKTLTVPKEITTRKITEDNGQSFSYVNGKSKTSLTRSFTIKIQEVGDFTIPALSIDYNGKQLSTDALILNIVAKDYVYSDLNKEDLQSKFFIRAEFENGKETCMLGERVIINTVIYTQIGIDNINIEEELGESSLGYLFFSNKEAKVEEVEFEGKKYYKKIIRSYIYNALIAKEVLISPAKVSIGRITNPARNYLDEGNIRIDTLSSNSLVLKVKGAKESVIDYLAKNGTEIKWRLNDSLIDKGILLLDVDLIGTGVYLFYSPPKLDFGNRATVNTVYLGQTYLDVKTIKKSYQYIIYCHEVGDFDIQLDWNTWNTEKNEKEVLSKSVETRRIVKTSPCKKKLTNINPSEHVKVSKRDVSFVIDCSTSMLAKDFDSTRFQAIQDLLRNLIHQKSNDERFSIVLVAGESFILCPLTFSSSKLLNSVDEIRTGSLMEGTDLTAGIMQGTLSLSESGSNSKDIVVVTDGKSNLSYLDRNVITRTTEQQKVRLNVVGIGIDGEFLIPVAKNTAGNYIYGKEMLELEEEELKEIAKVGGGIYTRINNPKQLKLDFNSLLNKSNLLLLNKKELIDSELVNLLLEDANYRHQKIRKEYVKIKDK